MTKCFNEAAAYHCGKRPVQPRLRPRRGRFNEAAAYHCGKLMNERGHGTVFGLLQ